MSADTFSKRFKIISVAKRTFYATRKIKEMLLLVGEVATWIVISNFQLRSVHSATRMHHYINIWEDCCPHVSVVVKHNHAFERLKVMNSP